MDKDNLISVIVPVYNTQEYLAKCIDSIINQTYTNLEIILVDDGSYDNSPDICEEYAQRDNRIIVIHKENGGASSCRNAGLEIATGKYVAFVDSDDWIDKTMYEEMIKTAEEYQADTVVIGFFRIRGENMWAFYIEKPQIFNSHDALAALIENAWMKNYSWNKLYNRKLFSNVNYPNGQIFEDIPVAYKLFDKSNKIVVLNQIKYYYVAHTGSSVTKVTLNDYFDYCIGHQNRYYELSEKYPDLKRQLLSQYISQTLNPTIARLYKKKIYCSAQIQEGEKLLSIQKFVTKEFLNLSMCGAVGRVGIYRLKLFSKNKFDKLWKFEKHFMPLYQKINKYIKRGYKSE